MIDDAYRLLFDEDVTEILGIKSTANILSSPFSFTGINQAISTIHLDSLPLKSLQPGAPDQYTPHSTVDV
jgi:hypothetical protein